MSEEQRRRNLQEASDLVPLADFDLDSVLRRVRRRLILETAGVTLIALIVCSLFGWIALSARGALWHQKPLQSLIEPTPNTYRIGTDVIIGVPVSLTGQLSREGAFAKQGYDMWLDWTNSQGGIAVDGVKHHIRAIYKDDQSKPEITAQATQSLITVDKAQFVLGSSGPPTVAAEAMVAEKNRIPLVEGNAAAPSIFSHGYRYTFGVLSPANLYITSILDMAAAQRPKPSTVALLSADDPFSQEVAVAAANYAPTKGFNVVFNQKYPNGSTDISGILAQAKTRTPDILLDAGHLLEAIAINKSAKDLKLDVKILGYTNGPSFADFGDALGKDANYAYGASQWTPNVRYKADYYLSVSDYIRAYREKYQTLADPHYHVAGATAAGLALQKAIQRADSLRPDRVRDGLAGLDISTFYGRLRFDAHGINSLKPMLIEQIQGEKHHTVWPASMSDTSAVYPAPPWIERTG